MTLPPGRPPELATRPVPTRSPPPRQGHLALPRRPLGRGGGPRSGRGPVGAVTARYAARAHAVELSIYPVWPTRRDRAGYRRGEGFGYSISQRASDPS